MIVSYRVANRNLKLYETEINEELLVEILKKHLDAETVYIKMCEDVDLLKGVGTNKNFVELI